MLRAMVEKVISDYVDILASEFTTATMEKTRVFSVIEVGVYFLFYNLKVTTFKGWPATI